MLLFSYIYIPQLNHYHSSPTGTTAERFFRIDTSVEHLHYVTDVISERRSPQLRSRGRISPDLSPPQQSAQAHTSDTSSVPICMLFSDADNDTSAKHAPLCRAPPIYQKTATPQNDSRCHNHDRLGQAHHQLSHASTGSPSPPDSPISLDYDEECEDEDNVYILATEMITSLRKKQQDIDKFVFK